MLDSGFLITEDNHRIEYTHNKNNSKKVIIIAHGFYNSMDSELLGRLRGKLSERYDVFMFDFRGHGKSSGLFTWAAREGKDLKAAMEYLDGKYGKKGVIAFSFAGSVSINLLSENTYDVDSLVCVSAPSDCSKIDYKWWKLDWENDIYYSLLTKNGRKGKGVRIGPFWLKKQKPISNVAKIKIPILYIHGDRDWVVEKWHSEALYGKTTSKKELITIKGGFHAEYLIRKHDSLFLEKTVEWFKNTL